MNSPAKYIDHTLLKADASTADISVLCEEAVEHGFASVCIPPCFVKQASQLLYGSDVAVCTVVGFPLGNQTIETKVFETRQAISCGATEVDMVINVGALRSSGMLIVHEDVKRIVAASEGAVVKVIIECCLLSAVEKRDLVNIIVKSGADYVKTSTGFAASGATVEDVMLLSETAATRIKVKASGGIRDWCTCQKMLTAGAERIGTSSGLLIMQEWRNSLGLSCL